ncbi:hypothetical protein B0H14DRAFT_2587272 [Mycena olivaceomarginata]|nr:hypothetical protein B0H14DRAFT_2587272 [Mycena olivaceomarginata]
MEQVETREDSARASQRGIKGRREGKRVGSGRHGNGVCRGRVRRSRAGSSGSSTQEAHTKEPQVTASVQSYSANGAKPVLKSGSQNRGDGEQRQAVTAGAEQLVGTGEGSRKGLKSTEADSIPWKGSRGAQRRRAVLEAGRCGNGGYTKQKKWGTAAPDRSNGGGGRQARRTGSGEPWERERERRRRRERSSAPGTDAASWRVLRGAQGGAGSEGAREWEPEYPSRGGMPAIAGALAGWPVCRARLFAHPAPALHLHALAPAPVVPVKRYAPLPVTSTPRYLPFPPLPACHVAHFCTRDKGPLYCRRRSILCHQVGYRSLGVGILANSSRELTFGLAGRLALHGRLQCNRAIAQGLGLGKIQDYPRELP